MFISDPTYQNCPCPMQSCPKNGLTGPLTGDSKRSNLTSISKDSMPLPPVALALPLEPNSVTGPPSPARGSAGMPPPPSPAGATYQPPPPPPTKREFHSPNIQDCQLESKRKARVGKAMVRNNIAAGMQHSTMLLMCNPQTQNYTSTVKREIESPKEKEVIEEKRESFTSDEEIKPLRKNLPISIPKIEENVELITSAACRDHSIPEIRQLEAVLCANKLLPVTELLQPVVSTVAENVKVKNMKRKLSLSKETNDLDLIESPNKKQKVGSSYKCLIKRKTNYCVKINNGKRKLIEEPLTVEVFNEICQPVINLKKSRTKRKFSTTKPEIGKRQKVTKPLSDYTHNSKLRSESKEKSILQVIKSDEVKKSYKKPKTVFLKSSAVVLDKLFAKNSIDRTIDSVVNEISIRTSPPRDVDVTKTVNKCVKSKEPVQNKKIANAINNMPKMKSECKKFDKCRKSRCNEVIPQAISKIPRRSLHAPRWSNGWRWEGESYQSKVFINVSIPNTRKIFLNCWNSS